MAEVIAEIGVSQPTYHRWRKQYGSMSTTEAKRLKELERENARLKTIVADLTLDNAMFKEITEGNW